MCITTGDLLVLVTLYKALNLMDIHCFVYLLAGKIIFKEPFNSSQGGTRTHNDVTLFSWMR